MELPAEVLVHNELLGVKGSKGTLIDVNAKGYYEVKMNFGDKTHRVLLPMPSTVVIASEAEDVSGHEVEIER